MDFGNCLAGLEILSMLSNVKKCGEQSVGRHYSAFSDVARE